jgi:hypothetical protein
MNASPGLCLTSIDMEEVDPRTVEPQMWISNLVRNASPQHDIKASIYMTDFEAPLTDSNGSMSPLVMRT